MPSKCGVSGDFPGGPVVRASCFHYRGCGFNPLVALVVGELQSHKPGSVAKNIQTNPIKSKTQKKTPQKTNEASQPASPSPVWHSSCTGLQSQTFSGFLLPMPDPQVPGAGRWAQDSLLWENLGNRILFQFAGHPSSGCGI